MKTTEIYLLQSWRLEVHNQGLIKSVWWVFASWVIDGLFSLCSYVVEGVKEPSRVSLIRKLNRVHSHDRVTSQRPHPISIPVGVRV